MIIWIASYPKSGNTWVRLLLSSLIFNQETDINDIKIGQFPNRKHFEGLTSDINNAHNFFTNCENAQTKLNLDNKIKIFKTHNAFWKYKNYNFTNMDETLGCIYVVRDPRNIITSIKNHFHLEDINDAKKFLFDKKNYLGDKKSENQANIFTPISSWSNHYNSWKKIQKNFLLIKYEDIIKNSLQETFKIYKFIKNYFNLDLDKELIQKISNDCNFKKLQAKELNFGFKEASHKNGNKVNFFHLGPDNVWQKNLDDKTRLEIENEFEKEMKELKYI